VPTGYFNLLAAPSISAPPSADNVPSSIPTIRMAPG
jgi:hypothetical protein